MKKSPGLLTPLFIAYRGKNAVSAPQTKRERELMTDGGIALGLKRRPSSTEEACNGTICLFPNLQVKNRAQNERPEQARNRRVKLKWLISKIPTEGPKAPDMLIARAK